MRIVEFCNSNSGFISAVLATLSFVLSAVAIFRSVYKELHADHETGAADNK